MRFYDCGEEKFPSVTTILDVVSKPALLVWYGKNGNEACKKILTESADRGTRLHECVQRMLLGDWTLDDGLAHQEELAVDAAWVWIKGLDLAGVKPEVTVHSRKERYAGTLDCIALKDGVVTLMDWKFGNSLWPEYAMQMAAYRHAYGEEFPDAPEVKRTIVVRFGRHGEVEEKETTETYAADLKGFLGARDLFYWRESQKKGRKKKES